MGYHDMNVTPLYSAPNAAAVLPSTKILSSLKPVMRATRNGCVFSTLASAQS